MPWQAKIRCKTSRMEISTNICQIYKNAKDDMINSSDYHTESHEQIRQIKFFFATLHRKTLWVFMYNLWTKYSSLSDTAI